jgi:hypothetical protein
MLLVFYSLCPSSCTPRCRCWHKFPPPSSLPCGGSSGGSSPWSLHCAPPGSFLLHGWLPSSIPQAIELPSVHHLKHNSDAWTSPARQSPPKTTGLCHPHQSISAAMVHPSLGSSRPISSLKLVPRRTLPL